MFVDFTGKVLRILPLREVSGEIVVDAILADEHEYKRVSFWGEHAEFVLRDVRVGDVLKIKNAYEFSGVDAAGSEPPLLRLFRCLRYWRRSGRGAM
ncbi:MAG: hypothetical protein MW690_001357 [Methanophagales archaeon]|nr:hypothetical protein [Methanophagales archaeon]MCU4139425.1 hypothetical protein [Methanophagales archaeon]